MKKISLALAIASITCNSYGAETITVSALPTADVEDSPVCYDATSGKLGRCANGASAGLLPVGVDWDGNEIGIYLDSGKYVSFAGYKFRVDPSSGITFGPPGEYWDNSNCKGTPYVSSSLLDKNQIYIGDGTTIAGYATSANIDLFYFPRNTSPSPIDKSGKTFYVYNYVFEGYECSPINMPDFDLYTPLPNDVAVTGVQNSYTPPVYWKMR